MFKGQIHPHGQAIGALVLITISVTAYGHHSPVSKYRVDETIEIEGVVETVTWRNPHSTFQVRVTDEAGNSTIWSVESGGVMELRLHGLDSGVISRGERVRVSGLPARADIPEMFGRNVLLESGREVLFDVGAKPELSDTLLEHEDDESVVERAIREADGIFRVWSSLPDDPSTHPQPVGGAEEPPLTQSAQAAVQLWDPATAPSVTSCEKAMPTIMVAPLIMQFVRDGRDILLKIEEFDTRRIIHMNESGPPADEPYSLLGYSVGRWERDRLVVETTQVDATIFADGIPLSRRMHILESFEISESGDRLHVSLVITDPDAFTSPFEQSWDLAWKPGLEVADYDCELL